MQIVIHRDDQEYGPYSLDQIKSFLLDGSITGDDYCRVDGDTSWNSVRLRLDKLVPERYFSSLSPTPPPANAKEIPVIVPSQPNPPEQEKTNPGCLKIAGGGCLLVGVLFIFLLVLAGSTANQSGAAQPSVNDPVQITLPAGDTFALLDRSYIADFEQDISSCNRGPVVEMLKERMKEYDPDSVLWAATNSQLQSVINNYIKNVQQQYIVAGKAEIITPGTYAAATASTGGEINWYEITYNGKTVYVSAD